jgi:hypothetical protein
MAAGRNRRPRAPLAGVPKVSWSDFLQRHPAAHLVVGVFPEDEAATSNARPQLNLMAKLIARLEPKGLYAVSVERQGRTPEIHCVFEKDADAQKLAQAVGASAAGRYPGWASQRMFLMDDATRRGIAAALKGR